MFQQVVFDDQLRPDINKKLELHIFLTSTSYKQEVLFSIPVTNAIVLSDSILAIQSVLASRRFTSATNIEIEGTLRASSFRILLLSAIESSRESASEIEFKLCARTQSLLDTL